MSETPSMSIKGEVLLIRAALNEFTPYDSTFHVSDEDIENWLERYHRPKPKPEPQPFLCYRCGDKIPDGSIEWQHVGGHGDQPFCEKCYAEQPE